ncbi:MAG: AraC family transcriptional regulator [Acidobacteriota bacterium]
MAVPTIASGALRKMLGFVADLGIERGELLGELGVDPAQVDDRDARIPIATLHAAWEALLARAPRADGAALAAERYAPGDYGLVGFVVMTSATLDEALAHFVRYSALWTDEPRFTREGAAIRATYHHRFADGAGKRMATEAAFTELVQGARLLAQRRIVPRAVRFAHASPGGDSALRAFFGCDVELGASENLLELDAADLALAVPRGDAQLGAFLRDVANQALAKREPDAGSLLDRARSIVAEELARGVPAIDVIAKKLAVSSRTLRRRLEEHGTSYRKLVDATREELARSYVRDRRIQLAEVAFLLGFSEPSAFHRAFKRWTSMTPAAWRAAS